MKHCLACGESYHSTDWHCRACGQEPEKINGFIATAPDSAHHSRGFDNSHFEKLANIEENHFWFIARNRYIIDAIRKYFPEVRNYLEIGCGTGFVTKAVATAFPALTITGGELLVAGLPFASQRLPAVELIQMDARRIPYREHFDLVGLYDVLEHIPEDETVLEEIHRALRPDGRLLLTVPQHPWLWNQFDTASGHVRRYTFNELRNKVEKSGFSIIDQSSIFFFVLPLVWAARNLRRTRSGGYDILSDLQIGALPNRMLKIVMAIESFVHKNLFHYPCGGSLLMAARKL